MPPKFGFHQKIHHFPFPLMNLSHLTDPFASASALLVPLMPVAVVPPAGGEHYM
jgi:hypothetical protein